MTCDYCKVCADVWLAKPYAEAQDPELVEEITQAILEVLKKRGLWHDSGR